MYATVSSVAQLTHILSDFKCAFLLTRCVCTGVSIWVIFILQYGVCLINKAQAKGSVMNHKNKTYKY